MTYEMTIEDKINMIRGWIKDAARLAQGLATTSMYNCERSNGHLMFQREDLYALLDLSGTEATPVGSLIHMLELLVENLDEVKIAADVLAFQMQDLVKDFRDRERIDHRRMLAEQKKQRIYRVK